MLWSFSCVHQPLIFHFYFIIEGARIYIFFTDIRSYAVCISRIYVSNNWLLVLSWVRTQQFFLVHPLLPSCFLSRRSTLEHLDISHTLSALGFDTSPHCLFSLLTDLLNVEFNFLSFCRNVENRMLVLNSTIVARIYR